MTTKQTPTLMQTDNKTVCLSAEDRILVKNLYFAKSYGAVRLINEFPAKGWKKNTLNDSVKRLKQTGSITRKSGSGSPKTARTATNIDTVDELVSLCERTSSRTLN